MVDHLSNDIGISQRVRTGDNGIRKMIKVRGSPGIPDCDKNPKIERISS